MKVLILNNIRKLWKNKLFLLLLLGLSSLLGFLFAYLYYGNVPMQNKYETELEETNVEQFRIWPTVKLSDNEMNKVKQKLIDTNPNVDQSKLAKESIEEIIDEFDIDLSKYNDKRIQALGETYKFQYELLERAILEEGKINYYISPRTEFINKYILYSGKDTLKDNEILMSVQFAKRNHIKLGEWYKIKDTKYKVMGTYYQPAESYLYTASSNANAVNTSKNCGIIMSKNTFDTLNCSKDMIYISRFDQRYSEKEFDKTISKMMSDNKIFSILKSNDLPNFTVMRNNFKTSLSFMFVGVFMFSLSILLVILQIIKNHFEHTKKNIGLLKAMGYKNSSIFLPYLIINIPIIIGLMLGMLLGYLSADSFMETGLEVFNYIVVKEKFNIWLAVVVVAILVTLVTFIIILKFTFLLRIDALQLIKNIKSESINPLVKISKVGIRKLKFTSRIMTVYLFSNIARFIVIAIVAFLGFILVNFAVSIFGLVDKPVKDLSDKLNYKYCYSYKEVQEDTQQGNDDDHVLSNNIYVIRGNEETEINKNFVVLFVGKEFNSIVLKDVINKDLLKNLTDNKIIISKKMANDYHLGIEDTLQIKVSNDKNLKLIIAGINNTAFDSNLYMNSNYISKINKIYDEDSYNQVYTEQENKAYRDATLSTKTQRVDQIRKQLDASLSMIPILVTITIIIVFSMSCLIAYLNINDNKKDIALLQLLGYTDRQIQKLIININSIAIIIGALVSSLFIRKMFQIIEDMVNSSTEVYISLDILNVYKILAVLIIYGIYRVATVVMYDGVKKIELSAVMYEQN